VWPVLRHVPDPTVRSYVIDRLGPGGAEARTVIGRLGPDQEADVSVRRALVLALGGVDQDRPARGEREALVPRVLAMYRDDPDSGIHGAVGWLLRQWQQQGQVEEIDRALATGKVEGNRQWYVNRQGQTLVVVPPGEFWMGEGQPRHQRRIDRSFALAAQEVAVAEFLCFRGGHPCDKESAPTEDCPVNNLTWNEAAEYCNWLSKQEGIPPEQWCYLPNEQGEYAAGRKVAADFLVRS